MNSLPDNAIDTLGTKVEFADEDWSTVPSTPKIVLFNQENLASWTQESKQLISKAIPRAVQNIALKEKTNQTETVDSSAGVENPSGLGTLLKREPNEVTLQKPTVAQHTVPSAPKTSPCKPKNDSRISMAASSLKNSKQSHAPAKKIKKNALTPKRSGLIQKKTSFPNVKLKLSVQARKKKAMLLAHGLPKQIATELCVMSVRDFLEKIPSLKADYPNISAGQIFKHVLQTPAVNTPKKQIDADKPSPIDAAPLRVGIQNSDPMNKEQMTKVHRHLILAIAEQWTDGGGPEFKEFKHMDGWIMVTCVDQRSKAWLLDELHYLEPWPKSRFSIMPEQKLPKLNTAKIIAFIPESEATSIQEALELLKAQNKGLNTEQWTTVDEKLESGKTWTVTFIIDEASLKTLEAQECRAAIGFTTMHFQIIPLADIRFKSDRPETSQKSPSSSAAKAQVADSVSSVPLQGNKPISTKSATLAATVTPILRADCDSRPVVQNSKTMNTPLTQNSSQDAGMGMPPTIGYVKHLLQDAKDRIEEMKQKKLSDRRFRSGRWDELPSVLAQQMMLEAKNMNTAQTISEDLRWREETSTSATGQVFSAPTVVSLDRNATGGITVIQQNFPAPVNLGEFSTYTTGRNPHMVPHSVDITAFGVQNAAALGRIGTGDVTVTIPQQNVFTAGSEVGTNLGAFSAQVTGQNLTMMPPYTVIPGFGVPNAATMGGSGIEGIAVTQENVFSAPTSQTQEMDYFLGPVGGSHFVQNQMMSQNCVNYGGMPLGQNMSAEVGDAAYQQNIALATMYPYSNPPFYINCYQDSQAAMSMLNQDNVQQGPVAQLSKNNNGSEMSRDCSPTREHSEEGYKSWIIEEAKRFASNSEDHSSLASTGALPPTPLPPPPPTLSPPPPPIISNYCAPMDQDPDRGSPFDQDTGGTYQDMHSRSCMDLLSPQARYRDSPYYRRRSYDRDSSSIFDRRQSPQAKIDRDSDIEDYEKYKISQIIREIKVEQIRPSREFRSPERQIGCRPKNIEDSESYESSWRSTEKRSDRDVSSRPNWGSPLPRTDYRDREIMETMWSSIVERSDQDTTLRPDRRSPQIRIDYRSWNIEGSEFETNERVQSSREKRDNLDRPLRPERRSPQQMKVYPPWNIKGSENNERSRCSKEKTDDINRSIKSERISPQPITDYRFRNSEDSQPMTDYTPWIIESSENNERSRCSSEETVHLNITIKSERSSPQPMKDYRLRNIEASEKDLERSLRESPQRMKYYRPRTIEDCETSERSRCNREKTEDINRSIKSERISPQPMTDYTPWNIDCSENNERSRCSSEETVNLDILIESERRSPQPMKDYRLRNIEASEKDLDRYLRPDRESPQRMKDYRPRNIEDCEINEKSECSGGKRDLDRSLRPDRKPPQPRSDSAPRNIEGLETNQKSPINREERDFLDKSLRPDRILRRPRRDYITTHNIEGSETNQISQVIREEGESLNPDRILPQPRRVYTPRNMEGSETTQMSEVNRGEREVLDKSVRSDRKSPQQRTDYTPRNSEGPETNQMGQVNRGEREVLDTSVRSDRKSPQQKRDYIHRNIEGSATNQMSQGNREERDILDKSDRKSPQPRRGFRPRMGEDVRDRSPRPNRRSPPPRRDYRPRIVESYETIRTRRERLIDRNRPRLNMPPPVRSGFRRDNIQDSRARFQDRRREGPGTWDKGVQRPRERDGYVRDRSPVPSRSTAKPREIRKPDMRPRR